MTRRRALLAFPAVWLAIATPALAQPFIIPLGRQPPRPESPPPPSPVPVAPPQAGPSFGQSSQPSGTFDQAGPADPAATGPRESGESQAPR